MFQNKKKKKKIKKDYGLEVVVRNEKCGAFERALLNWFSFTPTFGHCLILMAVQLPLYTINVSIDDNIRGTENGSINSTA